MTTTLLLFLVPAHAEEPVTPEDLRAVLTFRDEHMSIRELRTVIPGRVTVMGSGWGWGPTPWRGYSWTPTDVIQSPPQVFESWAVYKGPERLTVPEYLEDVRRSTEAVNLERKIRGHSTAAKVFGGLTALGLAAGVGGIVGSFADAPEHQLDWGVVGLSGLGTSIVSSIVSSATNKRAGKLASDFPTTQELEDVQGEVREYNEELREELGLSPAQAYRELDAPPRRNQRP